MCAIFGYNNSQEYTFKEILTITTCCIYIHILNALVLLCRYSIAQISNLSEKYKHTRLKKIAQDIIIKIHVKWHFFLVLHRNMTHVLLTQLVYMILT